VFGLPPAQKFTGAQIIAAALNIARQGGIEAVTARGLGLRLGTSSRPIFTAFRNMEQVQRETVKAARALYNGYVERGLAETPAFKGVGMQYIRFAREEAQLFKLLFMSAGETQRALENVLPAIDENSGRIIAEIEKSYALSREAAYKLYQRMWIFTHGIACLCATGVSSFTDAETGALLSEVCVCMLAEFKRV